MCRSMSSALLGSGVGGRGANIALHLIALEILNWLVVDSSNKRNFSSLFSQMCCG